MNKIKTILLALLLLTSQSVHYQPLAAASTSKLDAKQVTCLATNIYHEARGEPVEGQLAVALVTLNRVASNKFHNTVCGVVYAKYQFSWTLDKSKRVRDKKAWQDAIAVATSVLTYPARYANFKATHFHTRQVQPRWAKSRQVVAVIGNHIFYA